MEVTVITATYNRPDALIQSLRSLQRQSHSNWHAIVVGDCCDGRTSAAIQSVAEPRISYVNLALRTGEQSGPNSVGLRLARTPFVAFLNHDDIWLPDHLELALQTLQETKADIFVGRAAFASGEATVGGRRRPFFNEVNPLGRRLIDAFHSAPFLFEPVSTWVFTRDLHQRLGAWTPSLHLFRTPLEDWILRAARSGALLALEDRVSVLKVNTHHTAGALHYSRGGDDQKVLLDLIDASSTEAMRILIDQDLARASELGMPARDATRRSLSELGVWLSERLLTPQLSEVYLRTGWDAYEVVADHAGIERGFVARSALKRRTGENPHEPPSIDLLMQTLERVL